MYWLGIIVFSFLALRTFVVLVNWLTWPLLPKVHATHNALISILIPARNEAQNIGRTIEYIQQQDYQNYELLILDDHSDDGTDKVIRSYQEGNSKIRLLKGEILPKGWLGKNWACHQLAQHAQGAYYLFIDADVAIYPQLVQSALTEMKRYELSLLSIFPDQELKTSGEQIVVPIMHYLLLTLLPLVFVRKMPQPSFAAANGQFMLFDYKSYAKYQPHQSVKDQVTEDIETVKLLKANKEKVATYLGNRLVVCRMYEGYQSAIDGFSKNLLAGFGNSIIGLFVFLFLVCLGSLSFYWLPNGYVWGALALLLIQQIGLAKLSGQPILSSLYWHPLKMFSLLRLGFQTTKRRLTKHNEWKGRNVVLDK